MNKRSFLIGAATLTGLLLALSCILMGRGTSAAAPPINAALQATNAPAGEIHVCASGPPTCTYTTIQEAVDAATPGDVIKVAAGVYTGVQTCPAPPGYSGPSVITQVVYVSKTVTIRGGYTAVDWTVFDPLNTPPTLDAQRHGRVLVIAGDISPTVKGLN
ncbi:MAG: hypothetical protein DRI48_11030, partial [Chloroflexi bacterium]